MQNLSQFVAAYGYWAVVAGCLVEGETVLLLAGFAARQGLLNLPAVMALGACMGALSDIALFWLGRRHGPALLARWPQLARYRQRLNRLLWRWDAWLVIGVRFMYGMRIAGPILLGMSDLAWRRFLLFNLIGAALWGCLAAGAGWLFGHAAEALLRDVQGANLWALGGLALLLAALAGWRWWRGRRGDRP